MGQTKPPALVSSLTSEPAMPAGGSSKKSDATSKPVDPLALGQVLLRMEDYDGAIRAFRVIDFSKLRADDRAYAQYLLASALRAAGRGQEALPLYREVANSRADAMIADCARWQLSLLQWQQDLQSQLDTLRQRRKSLESSALSPSAATQDTGRRETVKESP
jgi:tetratricopeptide (TPR) repeat protein